MIWKNERPDWCPHPNCIFKMSTQNAVCHGELSKPEKHIDGLNTHRLCFDERETGHGIHDLQINRTDAYLIGRHLAKIVRKFYPKIQTR